MPRVSVIIPALNAEAHISQALDSVSAQTFGDWEIIVVDDGSRDRTAEVAEAHNSNPIVLRKPVTGGAGAARNAAIAASSGELLALLDADDYWLEEYLEHQVALYDGHGGHARRVGIVTCDASILGHDGFRPYTYMKYVQCPDAISLRRLLLSNPIYTSVLTSRVAVEEAGGYANFPAEDYDLWLRLVELGYRVVVGRRVLAVYRLGAASVSANPRRLARSEAQVYERALSRANLSPRERRIACRSLRRRRAIGRILGDDGVSYRELLRALPLLTLVALENPRTWGSIPRAVLRRSNPLFSRFEKSINDL
jgi:glycosyltransferase involved in cell wall biosynthesis